MHEEDFGTPLKRTDVLASPPIGTIELECKATGIASTSWRPEGLTSTRRRWMRVSVRRATCTCSRPAWMSPSTAPRAMSTSKD
ncbi:hypothetical protein PF008_g19538 [Phytophthora fragariae]|uniref:Uncharacterized protein n=1 Tax=Phytophthora fragariae TaxID=53985 RepID=A0A6A3DY12_9STRA|nr:hypothetical protein PF009_g24724 [Phytophthora fragariae]KAE9314187.1 hypothetical protein PF008_g19538 [Phytophthora fragariae]